MEFSNFSAEHVFSLVKKWLNFRAEDFSQMISLLVTVEFWLGGYFNFFYAEEEFTFM
jgi:hypothetical protein